MKMSCGKKGCYGRMTPDTSCNSELFVIGMNCILRVGDKHYYLRREMFNKPSQLQSKCNSKGQKYLIHIKGFVTKAEDGRLPSMKNKQKVVLTDPSDRLKFLE